MDLIIDKSFNEEAFINACINHERWAQKQLYEEYFNPMLSIAMRYANNEDDALDIIHDGFIKVFRYIHKYQVGSSLTAWIRRIIVNCSIDFYRKELRRKTEDIDIAKYVSDSSPDAISHLSAEEIIKAMQQLSVSYRSIFNLYVLEGYSHREVAEMLHISESTCRSNLVKARANLRDILLNNEVIVR